MTSRNLLFPVLVVGLLSGCRTPPKQAEVDANGNKIEYVYYTPTGSLLPIKVRKDQVESSADDTRAYQADLSKAVDRGRRQDSEAGSR